VFDVCSREGRSAGAGRLLVGPLVLPTSGCRMSSKKVYPPPPKGGRGVGS